MEWDFFIAHAGPETEIAERLYDHMTEHASVFLDSKNLRLGDRWDEKLQEAQRAAQISVILISDQADSAYYLKEEIGAAVDLARRDETRHRVVPIYLSREAAESENIPYGLRRLHSLFLEHPRDIPDAAEKLLQLLRDIENPGQPGETAVPVPSKPLPRLGAGLPDWFHWWQPAAVLLVVLLLAFAFRDRGSNNPDGTPDPVSSATVETAGVLETNTPEPSKTPTPSKTPEPTFTPSTTPSPSPTATARAGEDLARDCISNAQWNAVYGGSNPTTCLDLSSDGFFAQENGLIIKKVTSPGASRINPGIYTREELPSDTVVSFKLDLAGITTSGNIDTILMLGYLPADTPQNLQVLEGSFVYVFKGGSTSAIKIALKDPGAALTSYKQWAEIQSANFPPGIYRFEMALGKDSQGRPEMALTVTGSFGTARDEIELNTLTGFNPAFFIGYLMEGGASFDLTITDICIRTSTETISDACPWIEE